VQYFFSHDGQNQQGPVEAEELKQAGVGPQTLVWRDGMSGWTPARDVPEIAAIFSQPQQHQPQQDQPQPQQQQPASTAVVATPVNYQQPNVYVNQQPTNGLGIASLVCGILGILGMCGYGVGGFIPAVLAIVFGHIARGQIRRGNGGGDGMAVAGLIMGYISAGVALVVILILIFVFIIAIVGGAASGGRGGF
jgi:hypothetical protein